MIEDLGEEPTTCRKTAARTQLDLITIDMAASHLAGVLGRPDWILLSATRESMS